MKQTSRLFKILFLSLFAFSLTQVGCGGKKSGEDVADSVKDAAEESSEAQSEVAKQFKDGMVNLSKEMVNIADNVESAEDVTEAEPKIAEVMGELTKMFSDLSGNLGKLTMQDAQEMRNIDQDPEVKEWTEKVTASMEKLQKEHPDAAAKLQEVMNKHGEKLQAVIMGMMNSAMQQMGEGTGTTPPPSDTSAGK